MRYVQSALTYLQHPPEIFLSQPQGFLDIRGQQVQGDMALMGGTHGVDIDIMEGPNFDSNLSINLLFLILL